MLTEIFICSQQSLCFTCNIDEDTMTSDEGINNHVRAVQKYAKEHNAFVVVLSGKIEHELSLLEPEEQKEFLEDLGLKESGLNQMIREGYNLLGLQTYFTAGKKEIRAWTVRKNCKAPQAAGVIHSDFERGFICAEVYKLKDLEEVGNVAALKDKGLIQIQGKDYVVEEGDVMEFRFNV